MTYFVRYGDHARNIENELYKNTSIAFCEKLYSFCLEYQKQISIPGHKRITIEGMEPH